MFKKALLFILASFGFAATLLADTTRFSPYSGTLDIVSAGGLPSGSTMYINNTSLTPGSTSFNVTTGTVLNILAVGDDYSVTQGAENIGGSFGGIVRIRQYSAPNTLRGTLSLGYNAGGAAISAIGTGFFDGSLTLTASTDLSLIGSAGNTITINDGTASSYFRGGNFGVGATPSFKLDVNGTSRVIGVARFDGNVGVGSTAPQTKLVVSSGTLTIDGTSPSIAVGLSTFVVTAGNVGIGTSSPSASLHVAGTALITSTATFQPTADGTGTVKITNAAGDNRMFETDVVSTDSSNLVPLGDADMESGVGNWTNIGVVAGTLSGDSTTKYFRNNSIKYVSTTAANDGIKLPITLTNAANYTMTIWINATTAISTFQLGYSSDGSTATASIVVDSFTSVGNKWIKAQGQFTTPAAHSGTPFIFIKKSDTSARTFFVDGVFLKAGSASTVGEAGFYVGKLNMAGNSILTQPLNILPDQDSSHALAVYSSVGREIMRVDTSNRRVSFFFDASASNANPADAFSVNGAMGFWPGGTGAANTAGIKIREGANGTQVGQLVFFPNLSGDMVCQTNNGASSFRVGASGTQVMEINNNGHIGLGSIAYYDTTGAVSPSAHFEIAGENDLVQQEIFANGTQTNDLLRISNNARTSKLAVDKNFGLAISTATNGRMGQAVLVGGTVTVNNTSVTANTLIFLTDATSGGTLGTLSYTKIAGTSFTINSTNVLDTSTVNWLLIEMLP